MRQQNDTSDDKTSTAAAGKRQAGQLRQSSPRRKEAKLIAKRPSATEMRVSGFNLTSLLGSPVIRRLAAAGLVSAAAALIYRKPKVLADANESVQKVATELLDDAVVAASATSKVARKARRKAVDAFQDVAKPLGLTTNVNSSARSESKGDEGMVQADEAATSTDGQPVRKRRSDLGKKRASITLPLAGGASASPPERKLPPINSNEMETSAFTFGATPPHPTAAAGPDSARSEDPVAEAHPS